MVSNKCSITDEVERRLNDLFGAGENPPLRGRECNGLGESPFVETVDHPEEAKDNYDPEVFPVASSHGVYDRSPLTELKTAVMSMHLEINDDIMSLLMEQLARLKVLYRDDNVVLMFLKLLSSVGEYTSTKKADSHPDAVQLLNSIYTSLEKVLSSKDMIEEERNKILLVQVNKVKKLQGEIRQKNTQQARMETLEAAEVKEAEIIEQKTEQTALGEINRLSEEPIENLLVSDTDKLSPHEAFAYALEQIREVIKAEFMALRAELKLWRESDKGI